MAELQFGQQGTLTIHDDPQNNRVIVELSKWSERAHRCFLGKVGEGENASYYSSYVKKGSSTIEPGKDNTLIAVSKDHLQTDEQIDNFNKRVERSDHISKRMAEDFKSAHDDSRWFHEDTNSNNQKRAVIARYGQDVDKVKAKEQEDKAIAEGSSVEKLPKPLKNWAYGEVLYRNEHYVTFTAGENDAARFIRVLPTEKFLSKDEFANAKQLLEERLPVGAYKKLTWDDKGKITATDAVKKEKAQTQAQGNQDDQSQKSVDDKRSEQAKEQAQNAQQEQAKTEQKAKRTTKKKSQELAA
ncbi:TPA: hypothetical protein ACK3Q6_007503 [Burkholderia cepacia]|uniref:hypothetical protein n=1 Tax=Burkholderia cepacia complex TaxID=87882 RepID=UPI001CF16C56|nr:MULTISPECIES: hypothetical protein [Burkholderia cepacia complex]HDR9763948.1 hypothetical protein [Burkholderia cepacia ATCC 25416]MCA8361295.1 hypothetical protein [Burkholderia cepacia]MCW3498754.1 hypothetical protein [Burkholderia cenocepacia]MCW3506158.1 hypothetical protein [Burkholderia cenocepacia]MCW3513907.1 hypothetical protein [Burkholderia cenocepacia]